MKILFISPLLPHPYADHASAFTAFKAIKHLSKRHDFSLISFVRSEREREATAHLRDYCRRVETVLLPQNSFRKLWVRANFLTLTPISVSNGYCREMRDKIRSMVKEEKFDIVQAEYAPMGQYVSEIEDAATIINVYDLLIVQSKKSADHLGFSRQKLEWLVDSLISRRYESNLYAKFDHVIAISQNIKDILSSFNPSLNVSVIPPGVDIPHVQKSHSGGNGNNLIFMGAMWRPQNIDAVTYFYRSVFDLIRHAVPDVKLYIVGGSPSEEIRRLASDPSVEVTDYVEDILPYYLKCDVSIAPMRIGGGIQCKILDAMAAGLPVVTTTQGNEGVGASPEKDIIVTDTPGEFARRTIELLEDGNRRETISRSGRDFVQQNFGWEQIIGKIENIYKECLSPGDQTCANRGVTNEDNVYLS